MNEMEKMLLQRIDEDDYVKPVSREELVAELNDEIDRSEPDIDLINETVQSILDYDGAVIDEKDTDMMVKKLVSEARMNGIAVKSRKRFDFIKFTVIAAAASIALVGAGVITENLGEHKLSDTVVKHFMGDARIDVDTNAIELPVSESDPYGIKGKCREYGFDVMAPEYIPDGFVLININERYKSSLKIIKFDYIYNGITLSISYKKRLDNNSFIIPTDTYNIAEEKINEINMYILKEDNQFTAEYYLDNIKYIIFTDGLDYNEAYKIIESFK